MIRRPPRSTLPLHDALPISRRLEAARPGVVRLALDEPFDPAVFAGCDAVVHGAHDFTQDRKSTRLNSSHLVISYAVFCLKKKKLHLVILSLNVLLLVCSLRH